MLLWLPENALAELQQRLRTDQPALRMFTSAVFYALLLADFRGIAEMGLIAGTGLLVCLVPMLTLLPPLLVRTTAKVRAPRPASAAFSGHDSAWKRRWRRPGLVLAAGAVVTGCAAWQARGLAGPSGHV